MSEETRIILVNSVSPSEYITITNDFRKLEEKIVRLKNIINKTIESVQEHYDNSNSTYDVNDIGCDTYDNLMEILKGVDKK